MSKLCVHKKWERIDGKIVYFNSNPSDMAPKEPFMSMKIIPIKTK